LDSPNDQVRARVALGLMDQSLGKAPTIQLPPEEFTGVVFLAVAKAAQVWHSMGVPFDPERFVEFLEPYVREMITEMLASGQAGQIVHEPSASVAGPKRKRKGTA
jgi:hypothetical protein